jgi:hypothetical protein
MRFVRDEFLEDQPMDDLNKSLFTFASYNAGLSRTDTVVLDRSSSDAMAVEPGPVTRTSLTLVRVGFVKSTSFRRSGGGRELRHQQVDSPLV